MKPFEKQRQLTDRIRLLESILTAKQWQYLDTLAQQEEHEALEQLKQAKEAAE
jgi:hypothetical protein